jgi:uncharacterized membrane protein
LPVEKIDLAFGVELEQTLEGAADLILIVARFYVTLENQVETFLGHGITVLYLPKYIYSGIAGGEFLRDK